MHQSISRRARRVLASAMLVAIMSTTVTVPTAHAFLFPILGAPFRAIGRLIALRRDSGVAFPILGAPFRAVARIRQNSPFAFPILGAPFRFLAGGRVFANQLGADTSIEGSLP